MEQQEKEPGILHDRDIREPLFDWLEESYGKVRILEEKNICGSRADVVMILPNGICGIEIKSDADTYQRLAGQVTDYDRFFDYNFVVVGTSHAAHIREHVPEHWGVITVEREEDRVDFYLLRSPVQNPKVTWERKLQILWRPELARIQEANAMPKYKERSKEFVRGKIIEWLNAGKIPEPKLREQFSRELFERDYNTIVRDLIEYRKGELTKQIEATGDPEKKAKLIRKRTYLSQSVRAKGRRRMRRRTRT